MDISVCYWDESQLGLIRARLGARRRLLHMIAQPIRSAARPAAFSTRVRSQSGLPRAPPPTRRGAQPVRFVACAAAFSKRVMRRRCCYTQGCYTPVWRRRRRARLESGAPRQYSARQVQAVQLRQYSCTVDCSGACRVCRPVAD